MIELQGAAIKRTLSQTTTSESIHCNVEIAKRLSNAKQQLEEDYIWFFAHHRDIIYYRHIGIYFIDKDEYVACKRKMTKIKINLDLMRRRYSNVLREYLELSESMKTDNNKKKNS